MTTPTGPLALLGSGEFEPWTADLDRMLLEHASVGDGTVAIVPTASALEGARFDEWAEQGARHYAALGVPSRVVDLRGRDDAERSDVVEQLEGTSMIFFSGGNPAYLARTLAGSAFWAAVVDRLEAGAAFAGCSAGACVAGAFAPESMTDDIWEDGWVPGLGLVPDHWVLPHFDTLDRHRPGSRDYFLSRIPDPGLVLGIDERTAVARIGDDWSVVGEGGAFLARGPLARRFGPGERYTAGELAVDAAERDLVLAIDPLPLGAGPIAMLSSEQLSAAAADVDRTMLEETGPRIGIVLAADPSAAEDLSAAALAHYRALGADPSIVPPDGDATAIDAVFLAGGDPANLMVALQDSALWPAVLQRWRTEAVGLAGSSAGAMALAERCLLPEPGADLPTVWGRGLGPIRTFAVAPHASSRPEEWLRDVAARAPVDVLAMDDGTALLLRPARAPRVIGEGRIRRHPAQPVPAPAPVATEPTVRLFHRTPDRDRILREGFVDSLANPDRDGAWEGTWFADVPVDPEDGPEGPHLLVLEVPRSTAARYEWRDPSKPYRQFVLPREVVNRFGPPRELAADGTIRDPAPDELERADPVWPPLEGG